MCLVFPSGYPVLSSAIPGWQESNFRNYFYAATFKIREELIYSASNKLTPTEMNFTDILSLFRQGKGTAKSHMKNLIEMAAVDGNFDTVEFDLLKTIASRNGISESQLKEIRKNPVGIKFEVPADRKEKFYQLYDLVHMMIADNAVHDDEQSLCTLFAVKFGYSRPNIASIITAIRANIKNGQGHAEAMKRVDMLLQEGPVTA